jgi:excisionase family DNA binding protein
MVIVYLYFSDTLVEIIFISWYTWSMEIKLLTVKEFAAKFKVHPSTIRRAIECGRIHAFRIGNGRRASYRILESEIERVIAFDLTHLIDEKAKELNEKASRQE